MKKIDSQWQRGLTLVELLVAMVISIILLGGVIQVFLSSRQLYSTNSALARLQENGRFAMQFLTYDTQNTGFKGQCIMPPINLSDDRAAGPEQKYDLAAPIFGWNDDNAPTVTGLHDKTDALLIKHAAITTDTIITNIGSEPNNITYKNDHTPPKDSYLLVAEPDNCALYVNKTISNSLSWPAGSFTTPAQHLSINQFKSSLYYIKDDDTPGRLPSLQRNNEDGSSTPLVEGIIDLQIEYGISNDGIRVNEYVKAGSAKLNSAAAWDDVLAVRLSLLAVSPEQNAVDANMAFTYPAAKGINKDTAFATYDDGTVTIKERRVAQLFSSTIALRNKLP